MAGKPVHRFAGPAVVAVGIEVVAAGAELVTGAGDVVAAAAVLEGEPVVVEASVDTDIVVVADGEVVNTIAGASSPQATATNDNTANIGTSLR